MTNREGHSLQAGEDRRVIETTTYQSPCGTLVLGSFGGRLCLCDWAAAGLRQTVKSRLRRVLEADFTKASSSVTTEAAKQLDEYFSGDRRAFDIPLLPAGTPFQKAVWHELLQIPYGQTVSYSDIAKEIGRPAAVRAVANAIGANALSILIPCHRVIGSDRSLTGYAGGLAAKRMLIALEQAHNT